MSRLERTLVLWGFRYFEPRPAPAATYGLCEPLSFYRGAGTPLLPGLPHRFGTGGSRTFFGGLELFGVQIPLKTMDIWGRKITLCAWSRGAACWRRSRCTRNVFGGRRMSTSNGHLRLQVEPALGGSERLCLPAKPCPY